MKKGDFIWIGALILLVVILIVPTTRDIFTSLTNSYPYIGGFIKFGILATMGELLGIRITIGEWKCPNGLVFRILIWGIIGAIVTLSLPIFSSGVKVAQETGKLPFENSIILHAFLTSTIMNILQSPAIFLFHKCTDTYINEKYRKNGGTVRLRDVSEKIDWYMYLSFTLLKTIPLFWIPCHTVVFLLPQQYQVIAAAIASIALGFILAIASKVKSRPRFNL